MSAPRKLVTAREVAEVLDFKPGTILDWFQAGKIPGYKLGPNGRVRFDLDEVLDAMRPGGGEEAPTAPRTHPASGVVSQLPTVPTHEEGNN